MEIVDSGVDGDDLKMSQSPGVRKLKQSRLPFHALSSGTTSSADASNTMPEPTETRKRKPSSEELDIGHASKIGRVLDIEKNVTMGKQLEMFEIENKATEVQQKNVPDSLILPTDQTFGGTSRSQRKKHKNYSKKKVSGKILIKLPIGKKKPSTCNKVKASKNKLSNLDTLQQNATSCKIIQLDDTDLSEEGEACETKEETTDCVLSITEPHNSKAIIGLGESLVAHQILDKGNLSEHPTQRTSSVTKTNALDRTPTTHETDEKQQTDCLFGLLTDVHNDELRQQQPGNPSPVYCASDVDSSEEDIYMLCTPNSKTFQSDEESSGKLTPKKMVRRLELEKRHAKKTEKKEEKQRKLLEKKQVKGREKEEQDRQRRKEREEKEELKRKEREEKEELKRKEREEKEEQRRKEREEKEEQKRKEREEKEKRRQVEMEQRNEEKRLKEEERKKKEELKEEERKRKEEEKEAEEKRKQKVSQAFTSFFVKKTCMAPNQHHGRVSVDENSFESASVVPVSVGSATNTQRFMPFCVKGDMRLAPTIRRVIEARQIETLDQCLVFAHQQSNIPPSDLYLGLLRRNLHVPLKTSRTWSVEDEEEEEENDIMVVDESLFHQIEENPRRMKQKFKAKFFLFEENRRPPFRGTWRKQSSRISARRPFALDTKYFDYEVDSDDEWEEEEPGESLHGSDDEKDVDTEEDYEVDNEFFVPHGHLSDEELQMEEEGEVDDNSPEAQKAKLKIMQQEFAAEMKKKTEKIKPRLIGCIWEKTEGINNIDNRAQKRHAECSDLIWKMLQDRAMLYDVSEPISFTMAPLVANGNRIGLEQDTEAVSPGKENEKGPKKVRITDDAVQDLARLIHGNVNNRKFLVREFQAFWSNRNETMRAQLVDCNGDNNKEMQPARNGVEFSMESIRNKIREIAEWGACPLEGPMLGKLCWTVDKEVLEQYGLHELSMPNNWNYHLKGNKQTRQEKKLPISKDEPKLPNFVPHVIATISNKGEDSISTKVSLTAGGAGTTPVSCIRKFTQVISKDEWNNSKLSNLEGTEKGTEIAQKTESASNVQLSITDSKCISELPIPKKRIQLLMSVPRGHNINQSTKNSLISQFLAKTSSKAVKSTTDSNTGSATSDEIIEID